jgi:hypothetical protein
MRKYISDEMESLLSQMVLVKFRLPLKQNLGCAGTECNAGEIIKFSKLDSSDDLCFPVFYLYFI